MESRSEIHEHTGLIETAQAELPSGELEALEVTVPEVGLVNLISSHVNCTGPATGRLYIFPQAGAEVKVDVRDAEILLKKRGKGCCGGSDYPLFELAGR